MLIAILGFLSGFFGIEVISALIHQYIMHGPLWWIHQSHHQSRGGWERNDWFALLFGSIGVGLLFAGFLGYINPFWGYSGIGVSVYGFVYFVLHDVLIHARLGNVSKPGFFYLLALRRAHRMHHKHTNAKPGESYGLLFFHPRYFREEKEILKSGGS